MRLRRKQESKATMDELLESGRVTYVEPITTKLIEPPARIVRSKTGIYVEGERDTNGNYVSGIRHWRGCQLINPLCPNDLCDLPHGHEKVGVLHRLETMAEPMEVSEYMHIYCPPNWQGGAVPLLSRRELEEAGADEMDLLISEGKLDG